MPAILFLRMAVFLKGNIRMKNKLIVRIALLSALAAILMIFEFPIPFLAPDFYKLDFSEVPVIVGGFMMGPIAGCIIELVKILLNFIINGTVTAGVGETANFIVGCALVVPAAFLYKKKASHRSMIIGLVIGIIVMAIVAAILNYAILLPVYAKAFGVPIEAFIQLGGAINPMIVDLRAFVLLAVVPFNIVKGILVSIISVLLYSRIGKTINRY